MSSSIDPATRMGAVRLTVADLDRARSFYRGALGLAELATGDGIVFLRESESQPEAMSQPP